MRKSRFSLDTILGYCSSAARIGGNKLKIAEDAKQKAASYMSAKGEVENLEKLAQVLKFPACWRASANPLRRI